MSERGRALSTLWTVPRAEPPIVLAASPGRGAETMPPDVRHAHAVTTTTAAHARPGITLAPTHSEKGGGEKQRWLGVSFALL